MAAFCVWFPPTSDCQLLRCRPTWLNYWQNSSTSCNCSSRMCKLSAAGAKVSATGRLLSNLTSCIICVHISIYYSTTWHLCWRDKPQLLLAQLLPPTTGTNQETNYQHQSNVSCHLQGLVHCYVLLEESCNLILVEVTYMQRLPKNHQVPSQSSTSAAQCFT